MTLFPANSSYSLHRIRRPRWLSEMWLRVCSNDHAPLTVIPYIIFFFKIKNCLKDDLFISCDDRIGKMLHNICISALAVLLRWATRGPWASCLFLLTTASALFSRNNAIVHNVLVVTIIIFFFVMIFEVLYKNARSAVACLFECIVSSQGASSCSNNFLGTRMIFVTTSCVQLA